jgi:hypothetical protein
MLSMFAEKYHSLGGGVMEEDLHGYYPQQLVGEEIVEKIVRQAWEMGERELTLIHGHGRKRGPGPGFVHTNTGYLGLTIRRALAHDEGLRRWIHHTTLDRSDTGLTRVSLKRNPSPSREAMDWK